MSHLPRRPLYAYTYEIGRGDAVEEFVVYAHDDETAFDMACGEAAIRGHLDAPLRCVDYEIYDPSGGDGPED